MFLKSVAHRFKKHCPCFWKTLPMFFYFVAHHFLKRWAMFLVITGAPAPLRHHLRQPLHHEALHIQHSWDCLASS